MKPTSNLGLIARTLLLAALLTPLALAPLGCRVGTTGDWNRIGHVAPRSGPDQALGRALGEAVAIVVEEINENGATAIEGRLLTAIHGDSGSNLEGFGFTTTRLITVNRVEALIGALNHQQLMQMVPPLQTRPLVLVTPSGGLVDAGPARDVWAVGLDPAERGKYLAKYAAESLKLDKMVLVVDQTNPMFLATREGFEKEFRHPDRSITADWSYSESKELTDLVEKITAASPKAVLFVGRAQDMLKLRVALPKPGPTLLFGGEEETHVLRENSAGEGVILITAFTVRDTSEKVQKFVSEFQKRSGQVPEAAHALTADAARVLIAGARQAHTFRHDELIKKMPEVALELPTGKFWYTRDGQPRRTAYVMRISQGDAELVTTYQPEQK